MATFYIQLENKLLQISGDLTAENISKALGYVPVSSNVTNELSQRIDNITFDSLKDNPFLQDGNGELNIVDEAGNIITKIDADGIHSVDFIAGEHRLSNKTDKAYVDEAVKNVKVDLTGYATEEYVNNIDFYNINNNPIVNNGDGKLLFVDENGYIGLQLEEDGLYVKDVIGDGHKLSDKADKSELSNYATKDEVSDLVDMSVVTELQGKVETLVGEDADKSVRDIAVDVLTETLVSETATEAYDTLAEMSAWIKSHPEDASAMNTAIQENSTDIQSNATAITNLDAAYKAADAKVLTDAQEYTDNINFYTIKDNPIVDGEAGSLTFVDETGYIGLKVTEDGIIAKDFVTSEHTLSQKADKSELPTKVSELENDSNFITIEDVPEVTVPTKTSELTNDSGFITINDVPVLDIPDEYVTDEELSQKGYATEEWVNNKNYATEYELNNIEYSSIKNTPISEDETGELNITDENGNIGMKVSSEAVYAKDFISGGHKLSEKISGTNIKTINGQSILGEGDLTVEGGAKVYTWNWYSEEEEYVISQEEYDNILDANIIVLNLVGIISGPISKLSEELIEFSGECILQGRIGMFDVHIKIVVSTKLATLTIKEQEIPTKTSQLENDSNFVSSGNLKTINGQSIVGSGDLTIESGSSEANVAAVDDDNSTLDDVETNNYKKEIVTINSGTITLLPDKYYKNTGTFSTLDISLEDSLDTTHISEYCLEFTTASNGTSLSVPDTIKWANGIIPDLENNCIYQLSIMNNLGICTKFI